MGEVECSGVPFASHLLRVAFAGGEQQPRLPRDGDGDDVACIYNIIVPQTLYILFVFDSVPDLRTTPSPGES